MYKTELLSISKQEAYGPNILKGPEYGRSTLGERE